MTTRIAITASEVRDAAKADKKSKAAALRAAKEALAGCQKGEGRVEVYDVNPREVDADPIKTLRA